MKTLLRSRKPSPAEVDPAGSEEPPAEPPLTSQWTGGPSLATKAASALLWVALLAGPAALLLVVLASGGTTNTPAPTATATTNPSDQAAAEEFAQRFVTTWLTTPRGHEDALSGMVAIDGLTLPVTAWTVTNPAVAAVTALPNPSGNPGTVWSVTVAVDVADARTAPVRRFYAVPVQHTPGAVIALTQPAPVPAPAPAVAPQVAVTHDVDSRSALYATVQQFLTALLAGQGDVTRYLNPATTLAPVTPAAFRTVDITSLLSDVDLSEAPPVPNDGQRVQLLATATAAVNDQQRISVTYPLTMQARSGRWEVASIDPAPALQPPSTASPAAAPAAPSPTATPTASTQ